MRYVVNKLTADGDVKMTWDGENPEEVRTARASLEALAKAGYTLFLVDGSPTETVPAGVERIFIRRRIEASELVGAEPVSAPSTTSTPSTQPPKRGRGRPRKIATNVAERFEAAASRENAPAPAAAEQPVQVVAVPRMRGG